MEQGAKYRELTTFYTLVQGVGPALQEFHEGFCPTL